MSVEHLSSSFVRATAVSMPQLNECAWGVHSQREMRQNVSMANARDEHVFTVETSAEARGRLDLLLSVARMYYLEDRSQDEIATSIGYSRPTVSRLLAEARDCLLYTSPSPR